MIFASSNNGKIKEIREILKMNIMSLNDIGKKINIEENGNTFLENAIIKAKQVYNETNIPSIADDSGLEIDILNGFPGIKTNRFFNGTPHDKNQKILELMKDKKNRTCYFTCAIAYYDGINLITKQSRLKGNIAEEEKINNGFGFDSIFLYKNMYLSDMTMKEKNNISPRKKALISLIQDKKFKKIVDFKN